MGIFFCIYTYTMKECLTFIINGVDDYFTENFDIIQNKYCEDIIEVYEYFSDKDISDLEYVIVKSILVLDKHNKYFKVRIKKRDIDRNILYLQIVETFPLINGMTFTEYIRNRKIEKLI